MEPTVLFAWATLLVAFPLNVLTSALLWKMWRRSPKLRVLRERLVVAISVAALMLFFGAIFVNNDRVVPWIGLDATKWITRLAILLAGIITAGGWLVVYRRHRNSAAK